jgi:S1-C subfamily serine protease
MSRTGPEGAVLIDSVAVDSPAFRAGIRDGDQLIAVGWHEVSNVEDVRKELHNSLRDNGVVVLKVRRDGSNTYLSIRPD